MPGSLAGWKPFRRRARNFLRRMNLAKNQNSEANKMKKKTDAVQLAKSSLAIHGGAIFSAVCG